MVGSKRAWGAGGALGMRAIGAGLADGKTKGAAEYILAGKGYKGQGAAWGPS